MSVTAIKAETKGVQQTATQNSSKVAIGIPKTGTTTTVPNPNKASSKSTTKIPVKRVSRTTMVKLINDSKGRFFTSTHEDKEGNMRTMNCIKKKGKPTELGYITVWVPKEKDYRNINPQTLSELVIDGTHYKATK